MTNVDDIPAGAMGDHEHLCRLLEGFAHHAARRDAVADDERASTTRRVTDTVDIAAWTTWTLVGLHLFSSDELPDVRAFTAASRRVLLLAATERFKGNITRMARALGTSRRVLREHLKVAGLYDGPSATSASPIEDGE